MNNNTKNKNKVNVNNVNKLKGLKQYAFELNEEIKNSLKKALLILMNEMEYEKINITLLCNKSLVSMTAFYNNFQTKNDLLKEIVIDLNTKLLIQVGSPYRKNTSYDWYVKFFFLVKENSNELKLIFNAGFINKYLYMLNEMVLKDENIPIEKKYQRLIWSGGIANALVYWINNNLKEDIYQMAEYCSTNLNPWSI